MGGAREKVARLAAAEGPLGGWQERGEGWVCFPPPQMKTMLPWFACRKPSNCVCVCHFSFSQRLV